MPSLPPLPAHLFDLDHMVDLAKHPSQHRPVLVNNRRADAAEAECPHRAPVLGAGTDRSSHLGNANLAHSDSASSAAGSSAAGSSATASSGAGSWAASASASTAAAAFARAFLEGLRFGLGAATGDSAAGAVAASSGAAACSASASSARTCACGLITSYTCLPRSRATS